MPAAARQGDAGIIDCSSFTIAQGSLNVFINNKPAARVGDSTTVHKWKNNKCKPHVSKITAGSNSVRVNNLPLARVGDPFLLCTKVAQGSSNVFSG